MKRSSWVLAIAVAIGSAPVEVWADSGIQSTYDSYEGQAISSYWTVQQQFGTVALSNEKSYDGSQSLKFSSTQGGERWMSLTHSFGALTKGTIKIAFYDVAPGQETLYEKLTVYNSADTAHVAAIGTQDFDSQCYTVYFGSSGPNANCGIYPQMTTSSINRTGGWHVFEITFLQSTVALSIDGIPAFTANGDYKFDTVQIYVAGPYWRPDTYAYWDDYSE
jgi:hypothetical protein